MKQNGREKFKSVNDVQIQPDLDKVEKNLEKSAKNILFFSFKLMSYFYFVEIWLNNCVSIIQIQFSSFLLGFGPLPLLRAVKNIGMKGILFKSASVYRDPCPHWCINVILFRTSHSIYIYIRQ